MRKAVVIVAILAAVAASGYGYYRYTREDPAPTVATAKVTRGDIADTVGATGQLQAVTTVQVGTQVSGTLLELNADFNSIVRRGQVLARLDPSLFQTQIEQARANLIRAEADLERLRVSTDDARNKLRRAQELSEKKLIALMELEAAQVAVRSAEAQMRSQQAAVTQAQASLSQNQVNLGHTVIKAPIDGLVISRNVDVGQTVAASMSAPTLFLLAADLTKMQVIASLDESDVGRIRPGQQVRFRVDAYPAEDFTGAVTQVRLQPTTVQNVVTYATVISVPNPELKLKPGMTANVNIEINRRDNVVRVPNSALRFRPTNEIFAAVGQTPPPPPAGGGGRGGRRGGDAGPDTRMTQPAPPPASTAAKQAAAQPRREMVAGGGDSGDRSSSATAAPTAPVEAGQRRPDRGGVSEGDGRGAQGFGGGRGGGRGNFQERLAGLSPEEREQMLERMRARGFTPPSAEGVGSGAGDVGPASGDVGPGFSPADTDVQRSGRTGGRGGGSNAANQSQRRPQQAQAREAPARTAGATNIDALFGPLPVVETVGQVWLHQNGKLERRRLRLGISDGQQTELIEVLDGSLPEGTDVVTSVTLGAQRTAAAGNAFPGLGGQRGGFPGGPGDNRGGGGGGRGGR